MKFQYNKVYTVKIPKSKIKFGNLKIGVMKELFHDGRIASKFLERYIPIWFKGFKFVDKHGYDHVYKNKKFDLKCFTKAGMIFMPSNQMGTGRKFNKDTAHRHANSINYILCDINEFPFLRIVIISGKDLVSAYPSCYIPYKHRKTLFFPS